MSDPTASEGSAESLLRAIHRETLTLDGHPDATPLTDPISDFIAIVIGVVRADQRDGGELGVSRELRAALDRLAWEAFDALKEIKAGIEAINKLARRGLSERRGDHGGGG